MRRLSCTLMMALCLALTGCPEFWAKVLPVVTKIITTIIDAEQQLDYIEKGVDAYFKASPDPDAEARVRKAMVNARASLNVAARAAHAAQSTGNADYNQAFEDFRQMWKELYQLLKDLKVLSVDGVLTAGPHAGFKIQEPLAVQEEGP